ncbi:MAG: type II secretion system protein [Phycisphaerales bacterium]
MQQHQANSKRSQWTSGQRDGFTLMELMLTLAIIVTLLGFLASALGRASESARQTASQRSAEAIATAVQQFRVEFGFLPPLVHDGELVSVGNPDYIPVRPDGSPYPDGPIEHQTGGVYDFGTLVVWSKGYDFDFFRRRAGDATDEVELPAGGSWSINSAWDDRRYSRYALAYFLTGALPRSVDGISGQGMTRPLENGGFANVGYPIGSTRDRFEPTLDLDRNGITVQTGYARPIELAEHDLAAPIDNLLATQVYDLYADEDLDRLVALVDAFGTAFRYYRWEHGRYNENRQLVIESSLDLNIPPLLLDPELLVEVMNDDSANPLPDLTNGNLKLRQARFAIVGAGADRLFGTEPIEYLITELNQRDPQGDPLLIAQIRKLAMEDNVVAYGQ